MYISKYLNIYNFTWDRSLRGAGKSCQMRNSETPKLLMGRSMSTSTSTSSPRQRLRPPQAPPAPGSEPLKWTFLQRGAFLEKTIWMFRVKPPLFTNFPRCSWWWWKMRMILLGWMNLTRTRMVDPQADTECVSWAESEPPFNHLRPSSPLFGPILSLEWLATAHDERFSDLPTYQLVPKCGMGRLIRSSLGTPWLGGYTLNYKNQNISFFSEGNKTSNWI